MSQPKPDDSPRTGLVRSMGLLGLTATGVSSMVGAGINVIAGFARAVRQGDRIFVSRTTATLRDRVIGEG